MQDGPLQRYRPMVFKGAQELAAEKLQLLTNRPQYSEPRFGDLLSFVRRRRSAAEGLYLNGGVGRGKILLLDLFFESIHYAPKRRVHFQEFMVERMRRSIAAADPILSAATERSPATRLLCFDELEVTDITEAMNLGRCSSIS
jgi:cell division protein ZapE